MKKLLSFVLSGTVLVCLNLLACNPRSDYARKFEIDNNSDSSVYFAINASYPDSSLRSINTAPNQWQKLLPHEGKFETAGVFNYNPITVVFIFNAHTIETTPWDSVVKHYMVLMRYTLTKSDMEKNNWIISYP